jgi:Domain of unknown function (DUF4960)
MKLLRSLLFLFLGAGLLLTTSCGKDDDGGGNAANVQITSFKLTTPEERTGTIDHTAGTVSFQPLTPRTEITAVGVQLELPAGVTSTPASGATIDFSGGPVTFTITDGTTAKDYAVTVTVEFAPSIGFLGDAGASGSITEDDQKAAWDHLSTAYGAELVYIPFSSVNSDALKYLKAVFYYEDSAPGEEPGILDAVPASAKASSVVTALQDWHAAGGNFVLAGHGTQLLNELDRIPPHDANPWQDNGWAPRIYGSGAGTDNLNPHQWGVNANLNVLDLATVSSTNWDRSNHPIYEGLNTSDVLDPVTGEVYGSGQIFMLASPGAKEDHNSMWDINAAPITSFVDAFDKADQWEAAMEATLLGTWGHVVDLCCGAAVELHPRASNSSEGTIIAIGPAAYEYHQVAGNTWEDNVKQMTVNAIDYALDK